MIKNFLNLKGHQNPISGAKVTAILLKGVILPIGGALAREGLRLQAAQQACFFRRCFFDELDIQVCLETNFGYILGKIYPKMQWNDVIIFDK